MPCANVLRLGGKIARRARESEGFPVERQDVLLVNGPVLQAIGLRPGNDQVIRPVRLEATPGVDPVVLLRRMKVSQPGDPLEQPDKQARVTAQGW
jgi:hypothetical protein